MELDGKRSTHPQNDVNDPELPWGNVNTQAPNA